jgi:hypothetical protein
LIDNKKGLYDTSLFYFDAVYWLYSVASGKQIAFIGLDGFAAGFGVLCSCSNQATSAVPACQWTAIKYYLPEPARP